jgi:general secretion pathway protein J
MTRRHAQSGFTLVEMLVTLALLALISTYAISAIRTLSMAKRIEERIDEKAAVESVQRHLRSMIGDARIVFRPAASGRADIMFEGGPSEIRFVSVLDDRLVRGGLYLLHYRVGPSTQRLELDYAPFRYNVEAGTVSSVILLDQIAGLKFRYFGVAAEGQLSQWSDTWVNRQALPQLVEVSAEFAARTARQWPVLVIPVAASD